MPRTPRTRQPKPPPTSSAVSGVTSSVRERLLIMDSKQAVNHAFWADDSAVARQVPGTLAYEGFRLRVRPLPIADYQVLLTGTDPLNAEPRDWLYIESKTWPDLHASVRDTGAERADTRIRHQLRGLQDLQDRGHQVAVLLVGQLTLAGGRTPAGKRETGIYVDVSGRRQKKSWSYHELEVTRQAIEHLGVMTAIAPNEDQTPHTLWLLSQLCQRTEHFPAKGLARLASVSPGLGQLATIFTAIDGIGPAIALSIAEHSHHFPGFMQLTQKELEGIPLVGKVHAARLYRAFHSERDVSVSADVADFDPET